jgi:hypothetical protein
VRKDAAANGGSFELVIADLDAIGDANLPVLVEHDCVLALP